MIPADTQVLVTHGPPYGILDRSIHNHLCGSKSLLDSVIAVKPKLHIFGHIHEAYGVEERDGTTFFNASLANIAYKIVNKPLVFDI
jgi:Icc-related predicted phosphoesterase